MESTQPAFDLPFEKEYVGLDPMREEAGLADGDPLLRVRLPYGGEGWLARRYEDVRTVLSDPRFSRAEVIDKDIPRLMPEIDYDDYPNPLRMDPPDHTRLRKVGAKAFSARRISKLEPYIQQVIDDLLAKMVDAGPSVDLMEHFALPASLFHGGSRLILRP
jgi:cytochrome P450